MQERSINFFNWSEGTRISSAPIVSVMEKVDGSLGVLYRLGDEYRIATRGSFDGEQALWATQYLQSNYDLGDLPEEYTLLFEIVYPENRIVVDYGEREDMVLLAIRNRFTGNYLPLDTVREVGTKYGFSVPEIYEIQGVDTLIEQIHQFGSDVEGYVVEFADGQRFQVQKFGISQIT